MPVLQCKTKDCRKTKTTLQNRGSKFEKFQELKIQELTEQVLYLHFFFFLVLMVASGANWAHTSSNEGVGTR